MRRSQRALRRLAPIAVALVVALGAGPLAAQLPTSVPLCVGDCDASAGVTVDEILVGVNIALGQRTLATCPAFDRDGSDTLTVDELVSGVDAALNGCVIEEVEGPFLTALRLVRADDVIVDPIGVDALGREIYLRPFGSGFSVVIEARPGLNGVEVGRMVFEEAPDLATLRPDIQVIVSSPMGDGSPVVCDDEADPPGGVRAAEPFVFHERQVVTDVINEMSCRVDGGARSNDVDACTLSARGNDFGFAFVNSTSKAQFCLPIARAWAFPVGDTVVAARVRDILGNAGEIREIIVRIPQPPAADF